jgi:regulator of replication initiation timing
MSDLAEANDQLTPTIDDLQDQLAQAMSENANLKGRVAQLEEKLTKSRAETAAERRTAEVAGIELTKVQVRIDVLAPPEEQLHDACRSRAAKGACRGNLCAGCCALRCFTGFELERGRVPTQSELFAQHLREAEERLTSTLNAFLLALAVNIQLKPRLESTPSHLRPEKDWIVSR